MKQKFVLVACILLAAAAVPGQTKPDLNGTWVRKASDSDRNRQYMVIEQKEDLIHVSYNIDDPGGKRILDLRGRIDGQKHEQTVLGSPATLITRWEGNDFLFELIRRPPDTYIHSFRRFRFAADQKSFTTEATYFLENGKVRLKQPETWTRK